MRLGEFIDAAGRQQSGSLGLGLYIAKEIVVAHGGTIKAESSEEEGTTIFACLPQNVPHAVTL